MHFDTKETQVDPRADKLLCKIVRLIREAVSQRYGSELTFEERRDAAAAVTHRALWLDEELDLASLVTNAVEQTSRQLVSTLSAVGLTPPSRAPLDKHVKRMVAAEMSEQVEDLEQAARRTETLPVGVAAVSCGMDRGAVRMVEVLDPATAAPTKRREPYERTPPPPSERPYRMASNGNTTLYDELGQPLHTFRYAA